MTTFISYSRVHSEFVVRLAKDLKAAGFDVWLDQLDIPKGARWDDAIEEAVERSSAFMIVLAPESIESQNVKDELSYAIDSGKHILPVVIKPCKIPLRLRRLQYVDFTDKPYKESLADIKHLLNHLKPPASAHAHEAHFERPAPAPVAESTRLPEIEEALVAKEPLAPPEPPSREEPVAANPLRRLIVPIVLALIGIGVVVAGFAFAANRSGSAPATLTAVPPSVTSTETVPASTPVPPPALYVDQAGVSMRLVSAGEFMMGTDFGRADEGQAQSIFVDTFYIDKYEVTNALYGACVEAGACPPPREAGSSTRADYFADPEFANYPVVYVDWKMARMYCEWRGARLPTEAEWEKAARGTDGRTYPWGEDVSCNQANYFGCQGDTSPVTSFENGLSVDGVYNLAGNVSEWVSSLYMPYPYDPADGREAPDTDGERVLRGGSWINFDSDNEVRSAYREKADPLTAADSIGFRCALTAIIPETGPTLTEIPSPTGTRSGAVVSPTRTREPDEEGAVPNATSTTKPAATASRLPSATPTAQPPTNTPLPPPTETPIPPTEVPPTEIPPTDIPPTDIPPTAPLP